MRPRYSLHKLSFTNKLLRASWGLVWLLLYRPSPKAMHWWRCFLLRCFGARLGKGVHPYPSSKVWAPWNLEMGDHSCLGEEVDCYCVGKIEIGKYSTVSQYSFLCTASHDYSRSSMPLLLAPIRIGNYVWITADVFIGPGIVIGDGTVVTARSTVTSDLPAWSVATGNPASVVRRRTVMDDAHIGCKETGFT